MEAHAYNPSIGSVGQKIREVEGRMKEIEGEGDRQTDSTQEIVTQVSLLIGRW